MRKELLDRFYRYISIDTQSDYESDETPSTMKQFDLANLLVSELQQLGLDDAQVNDKCCVMATLPSNTDKDVPVIGFLAHLDTSPDLSGKLIRPKLTENYNGEDILLNEEKSLYLRVHDFPELRNYIGQTMITTDGTTLLGADNKAGIAEIITALEYMVMHQEIKHGTIKVAFTPDEEIGRGVNFFDVEKFGAKYAYTVDGGVVGEIEIENFNAAIANLYIQGLNVHPGGAKNKMLNSILVATEFNAMLPEFERPECTEQYEGFYHLTKFSGTVERTTIQYIIRDHCRKKFERKKELIYHIAGFLNKKYGEGTINVEVKDQYYNMREKLEQVPHIVDIAKQAMADTGIKPLLRPIRGGTDGARLSFMGLPCPNIFTGGHNFHSKYEFITLESMEKSTRVIIRIAELFAL